MPSMWDKMRLWLLGDEQTARERADATMPRMEAALPTEREGDEQDGADALLVGGVFWPTEMGSHGVRTAISSWAFLAEYDPDAGEVYLLDTLDGSRHIGAKPLIVDDNVKIHGSKTRQGKGLVFRTALFGEEGLYENIFWHLEGEIIAHHRSPNPPTNSTHVLDPDGDGVSAGLHTAVYVVEWVKQLCAGRTAVRGGDEYHALALNFGTSGDGTQAMGLVRFDRALAVLSDEAKGPLAAADDGQHQVGPNGHQGGINITEALFGDKKAGILYSPAEFFNVQYPPVAKPPFPVKTEWREDFNDTHQNYCGKDAKGRKKWVTWITRREYPPAPPPKEPPPREPPTPPVPPDSPPLPPPSPTLPPEGAPPVTGDEPPPQIAPTGGDYDGPSIELPKYQEGQPRISDASPAEVETPSEYGHAEPNLPDGPHATLTDGAETEYDRTWAERYGFNEVQWNKVPLTHHDMALPQYRSATRGSGPEPWPTEKYEHEDLVLNDDNSVNYRERTAMGPGSKILGPAWARAWHALVDFKSHWRAGTSNIARVIMAGKNAAGSIIDGRLVIGLRTLTSALGASGWSLRLLFDGKGGASNPDLDFTPLNESGEESAGGAVVRVNGNIIAEQSVVKHSTTTTLDADAATILCDTDSAGFVLSLDSSPAQGRTYRIVNIGSSANNLTVRDTSNNIKGSASDLTVEDGNEVTLTFDATEGWW